MKSILLLTIFFVAPLLSGAGQASAPNPVCAITPASGDLTTAHQVHCTGVAPVGLFTAVLIDPAGDQSVTPLQSDVYGGITLSLVPPGGTWKLGLYRLAIQRPGDRSVSATFAASDGAPHLWAEPYLPSPTSAFHFVGIGLPPNIGIRVQLFLTGGQGEKDLEAGTDAAGDLSTFVWPQQFGLSFFAAGDYRVVALDLGLAADFRVREHPASSMIAVDEPVVPGQATWLRLANYPVNRYVWGVYATADGTLAGEFLVGPTDARGGAVTSFMFPGISAGQYLVATPYDWGETSFVAQDYTPTPTATDTPTLVPTSTPKPTATRTQKVTRRPKPTPTPQKAAHKRKHRKVKRKP